MKISNIISEFEIFTSNEEKALLDNITKPCYSETLSERELTIAENLVRKSLLTKVNYRGSVVFVPNEKEPNIAKAYFAGGCFWGVEYFFEDKDGVI